MSIRPRQSRFKSKYSRRAVLRGGALGAAGLAGAALIGCSSDDGEPGQASQSEQPKPGGVIRLGIATDITSLEPHLIANAQYDTLWPIFDTLTQYDHDLKPQGKLAKTWEQTENGSRFVLHLREGVTYHTGKEFTSADVKWNLERVKDPSLPFAQFRTNSSWFPTLETPDKNTIILKSDKPRPATFDFFEFFRILDSVTMTGPEAKTTAVGTGPWKFKEWKQGINFAVTKNPTYWESGKPYLDGYTWSTNLQNDTMLSQFESDALDGAFNLPITGFVRLRDNPKYQSIVHPAGGFYYLMGFNTQKPPFTDKRVRQAFNWAIDRKRYADLITKNISAPASLPWPKVSLAYEESKDKHYSFDAKKAADLLSAAGASNVKTTIYTYPPRPEVLEFVPIWQNDLKGIGVDMQIRHLETAAWIEAINALNYDAVSAFGSGAAGLGSPSSLFSTYPNLWGGDGKNNTGFTNTRWQELITQASTEFDVAKQKGIYSELNTMLLDESHLAVYAPQNVRMSLAAKVRGVSHHALGGWEYTNSWFA